MSISPRICERRLHITLCTLLQLTLTLQHAHCTLHLRNRRKILNVPLITSAITFAVLNVQSLVPTASSAHMLHTRSPLLYASHTVH